MSTVRITIAAVLFILAAWITPDTKEGEELLRKIGTAANE